MGVQMSETVGIMSLKVYTFGDKKMRGSEMELIRERIDSLPYGHGIVVSDFTDLASYQNAKKCLLRLEQEGLIRRVMRGIYDKPYYSKLLNERSSSDPEQIGLAIARNYNWRIVPSGLTALNLLGLSTQVPNSYEYYSSGPYRNYTVGSATLVFKHKSSRDLLDLSYKTSLVIQTIKEIGKGISESEKEAIRSSLTSDEQRFLLMESAKATKWVYEIVKDICKGAK